MGKRGYFTLISLLLVLSMGATCFSIAHADEEVLPEIPRHPIPPIDRGGIGPAFMSLVFGPGTGERINEGIEVKLEETWIGLFPVLGQLVWISTAMDAGNGGIYTEMYGGLPPELRPEGGLFPLLLSLIVGVGTGQRYNEGYDLTAKEWLMLVSAIPIYGPILSIIPRLWSALDAFNGKTYSEEVRRRK